MASFVYLNIPAFYKYENSNIETRVCDGLNVKCKIRGKIKSYKMDKIRMGKSASVGDVMIHYGGKTGKGKRIDMEMASSHYKFKLNIRDTQGGDGYPTRMMCDFTTL